MILKIKTIDKNGWVLIDGIRKIKFLSIDTKKIKEYNLRGDTDYVVLDESKCDDDVAIFAMCSLLTDQEYNVMFNTFAFLLSNEGKTIERL